MESQEVISASGRQSEMPEKKKLFLKFGKAFHAFGRMRRKNSLRPNGMRKKCPLVFFAGPEWIQVLVPWGDLIEAERQRI
jgi:hypothetical protein